MKKIIWITVVVVVVLGLAAGTIAAQNWAGESNSQPDLQALLSGEGILVGRIDNRSVEIEIEGNPQAFGLSDELRDREFAAGQVSFKYYLDKNGQPVITEADWAEVEAVDIYTAEGIFNGQADSHTVEIEIDGEAKAFGLEAGISFAGIEEGEQVFIAYRQPAGGRPVIIKVERIF